MKRVQIAPDGTTVANVSALTASSPAGAGIFMDVADPIQVAPYWSWNGSTSSPIFTYGAGPQIVTADSRIAAAQATADAANSKADTLISDGLTGANRQQAVRVQVTPDANGRVVFTYPMPYVSGTKPAVTTTAETPNGATYRNDASVEENSATNTQVVILVQRVPKTIVVSLLGSVTSIIAPVTTPVWINVLVRAPV